MVFSRNKMAIDPDTPTRVLLMETRTVSLWEGINFLSASMNKSKLDLEVSTDAAFLGMRNERFYRDSYMLLCTKHLIVY